MDAETQERWAEDVANAWRSGDEAKMQTLCRDWEVTTDPDDPFAVVTIHAAPRVENQRIEFTVLSCSTAHGVEDEEVDGPADPVAAALARRKGQR